MEQHFERRSVAVLFYLLERALDRTTYVCVYVTFIDLTAAGEGKGIKLYFLRVKKKEGNLMAPLFCSIGGNFTLIVYVIEVSYPVHGVKY